MALTYQIVEAGGTTTDLQVTMHDMNLVLAMTYYRSGLHQLTRSGDMTEEIVALSSDPNYDTSVSVYLLDDPVYEQVDQTVYIPTWQTNPKGEQVLVQVPEVQKVTQLVANEGVFLVDACRHGLDTPHPLDNNLVMNITQFTIPKGFTGKLEDIDIKCIKVV